MKIDVISLSGKKGGSVELPDAIFGIDEIRGDILQRLMLGVEGAPEEQFPESIGGSRVQPEALRDPRRANRPGHRASTRVSRSRSKTQQPSAQATSPTAAISSQSARPGRRPANSAS